MKIILDCETTGLNSREDEILQLSIIDDQKNILFDQYLKPKTATSWRKAERIHGISPEAVVDHLPIDAYRPAIQTILDKATIIIGYNIFFDLNFLKAAGFICEDSEIVDVMEIFADIYGEWSEYFCDFKWQKLTTMAEYYDYQWDVSAHNSLGDCFATLYCYQQINAKKDKNRGAGGKEGVY